MQWEMTISAKGQVTIPKDMRELLGLRPGDQLIYSMVDGHIVMTPKNVDFNDLAGFWASRQTVLPRSRGSTSRS